MICNKKKQNQTQSIRKNNKTKLIIYLTRICMYHHHKYNIEKPFI
jgi:hypothetical protein